MKVLLWIVAVILIIAATGFGLLKWMVSYYDSPKRFMMDKQYDGIKVACIGDSITQGNDMGKSKELTYPSQLSLLLGDEYAVKNFGVMSSTATSTGDKPYINLNAYTYSKQFEPNIVLIMFGTNDSKTINWDREAYKKDYKALIESYVNLPSSPRVIVLLSIKANDNSLKVQPDVIQNEIIPDVKVICDELNIEYVDLNTQFADKQELYNSDGIHLTDEGNKYMAQVIYESVDWK